MSDTITRSLMSFDEAVAGKEIPREILESLTLLTIPHLSFDGDVRTGQLLINREHEVEIKKIFAALIHIGFPIAQMVPVSAYGWDDDASMAANNCYAFDLRMKTGKDEPSEHAFGALDLNPMQNPFIGRGLHCPPGAAYDPTVPGTVTIEIASIFKSYGWVWGGEWVTIKDYQHFEKPR
jgi:poly-gamma-glutamate synthesis protein (capsule biosynthesis protein)